MDVKFVKGLLVKAPSEKAPDFVKAKISMKRVELIEWLQNETDEWINADVKVSQGGKWYAQVDNWRPDSQAQPAHPQPNTNEIPPELGEGDLPF